MESLDKRGKAIELFVNLKKAFDELNSFIGEDTNLHNYVSYDYPFTEDFEVVYEKVTKWSNKTTSNLIDNREEF